MMNIDLDVNEVVADKNEVTEVMMKKGAMGRAVYDFATNIRGELPLCIGDVVQIQSIIDKHWYYGNNGEMCGKFPASFVTEVPVPSFQDDQRVFVAFENFCTSVPGDLSFCKGDIIIGSSPVDSNWWKGNTNLASGIFPLTHVWAADVSLLKEAVTSVKKVSIQAKVKMNMTAQLDEEMDLHKDDIITITEIVDNDWYRGECNGQTGIFPSSFVEIINPAAMRQESIQSSQNTPLKYTSNNLPVNVSKFMTSSPNASHHPSSQQETEFGVVPYCWSLFPFAAQQPDELSFNAGEIIKLIRHIDSEWSEGEIEGRVGLFPKSHVEIMIDCSKNSIENKPSTQDVKPRVDKLNVQIIPGKTQARVLYDYISQADGDLNLVEDELITILSQLNSDWFEAKDSQGVIGLCPANYVECLPNTQMEVDDNSSDSLTFDSWEFVRGSSLTSTSLSSTTSSYNKVVPASPGASFLDNSFELLNNTSSSSSVNMNALGTASSFDSELSEKRVYNKEAFSIPSSKSGLTDLDKSIAKNLSNFQLMSFTSSHSRMPERSHSFSGFHCDKNLNDCKSNLTHSNRVNSNFNNSHLKQRSESLSLKSPPPRPQPPQIEKQSANSNKINPPTVVNETFSRMNPPPVPPPPCINRTEDLIVLSQKTISGPPPIPPPPKISLEEDSPKISQTKTITPSVVPLRTAPLPPNSSLQPRRIDHQHSFSTNTSSVIFRSPLRPAPPVPIQSTPSIRKINVSEETIYKSRRGTLKNYDIMASGQVKKNKMSRKHVALSQVHKQLKNAEEELDSSSSTQQYNTNSSSSIQLKLPESKNETIMEELTTAEERKKENKEANIEKRKMVISELISTEKIYIQNLGLCVQTFMKNPKEGQSKGIDMDVLFGKLDQIIQVSEKFLKKLEAATVNKPPEDVMIGPCFQEVSESMKNVYGNYCASYDNVINLMEKYQEDLTIQKYFSEKLEIIRKQTPCFDLSSLLIKPVQRISKYPLLLNELLKYTEEDHLDKKALEKSYQIMIDLANSANELKRRKELVEKYLKDADTSISSLLSKLTLHSVVKKSTRIGMRLSSSIGLTTVTKDEVFDEAEQKIRDLHKTLETFLKDLKAFRFQLEEWVKVQFQTAEDIASFYMDECKCPEVDQYRTVHRELYSFILKDFNNFVTNRVEIPLNAITQTFHGPLKLIDKRYDKLLDYESSKLSLDKNKDASKVSQLNEEYQMAKSMYEALNSQLIEELPKLFDLALSVFQDCVEDFTVARKRFIGRVMKQMLPLMELPSLKKINEDILESFQKAYVDACAELSLLSFIPKNLFPSKQEAFKETSDKKSKPIQSNTSPKTPQAESHRKLLQNNFPRNRIYSVIQDHQPRDEFEVAVIRGDIVGVIKEQDPMGKTDRWFIDNGISKGFAPSACFGKYEIQERATVPPQLVHREHESPPSSTKWYTPNTSPQSNTQQTTNPPSNRSLPVVQQNIPGPEQHILNVATSLESQDDRYDLPPDSPTHLYELPCDDSVTDDRYDIPLEEDVELVDVSDTSAGLTSISQPSVVVQEVSSVPLQDSNYFYAAYDFSANTANELSLRAGQVVQVLHKQDMQGNTEWWFVQDRYGNKGFSPASYLFKC